MRGGTYGESVKPSISSRALRIFGGWSANIFQLLVSLTQQIVLIPLFLRYWGSDTLSAWLTLFAAGSLVFAADAGLHAWTLNQFLSFRAQQDTDLKAGRYYRAALPIFVWFAAFLTVLLLIGILSFPPSKVLGFGSEPHFDLEFAVMTVGMVVTLPVNLAAALYRASGRYQRIVNVQTFGMLIAQIGQIVGVVTTGNLLVVVVAYVVGQIATTLYILTIDVRRHFPFLKNSGGSESSLRWVVKQFAGALPFGVMNFTEIGLSYVSILLIGAFVSDRTAIAQWGLTRTIAALLRGLSFQMSLPLAAELGYDHSVGSRDSLNRLYARGSAVLMAFAAATTAGALAFWQDFFTIWTHGAVPHNGTLTATLLLGSCVGLPALLALNYANYSNRGNLLLKTKSLQLAIFATLSFLLIPPFGPLGAAIALVASDIVAQAGILFSLVAKEVLKRPLAHASFLIVGMIVILVLGWALGGVIRHLVPGMGMVHFLVECATWLIAMGMVASPLLNRAFREKLVAFIPH